MKGTALKKRDRFAEAIECFKQSVAADPGYAEAFNNLGETLADMGRPDEAISFFRKALELKPDFGLATGNLYYALNRICAWEQMGAIDPVLDRCTAKAIETDQRPPEDPFLNLIRHDDPEDNYTVAAAWSSSCSRGPTGWRTTTLTFCFG